MLVIDEAGLEPRWGYDFDTDAGLTTGFGRIVRSGDAIAGWTANPQGEVEVGWLALDMAN